MKLALVDRKERNLLIFASLAHAVSDGWHILYPSLLFLIAIDFNQNYVFLGILANIILGAGGLGGIVAGFLSDRFSSRLMFAAFALLSALGSLLVFASRGGAMLAVALFILGVGMGIYHPVGLAAITRNIKRRSEALGIHGMAGSIGLSIFPVLIITLGVAFGWRPSFLFAAIVSLLVLALLPLIPREFDRPRPGPDEERVTARGVVAALGQRRMLAVYVTSILRGFAMAGFLIFLATAVALSGGLGQTQVAGISTTGLFTSIVFGTGAIGSFLGGKLGQRFSLERLVTILTLAPIPLLLLLGAAKGVFLLALAPFIALTLNTGDPILGSLIGKYLPNSMHGKGFAVLYGVSAALSSVVGVLAGAVAQHHGVNWVFPVMAVFLFAALPVLRLVLWPAKEAVPPPTSI